MDGTPNVRRFNIAAAAAAFAFAIAAVFCYEAAMMSKEEGITLPAVLLLYEWVYGCGYVLL